MSEWIIDRVPENNHDVLVSLKWDEQARVGFYFVQKGHDRSFEIWHVWNGDCRDQYDATDVEGWMPIPKSIYAIAQEKSK